MTDIAGKMEVVADADALAQRAAEIIAERLKTAKAPFRLVLSGGSTPRAAYQLLAGRDIDWSCAELFFSDERFVPPDHPDSNYRMVRETLLAGPDVTPRKLLAIPTDGTPQSAADRYDETLRQQYGASQLEPGVPLFHLTLLGLGDDGHTASLLPGQPVLQERERWAALVPEGRGEPRITLTYPALNSSELIIFLVSGAAKRDALAQARGGALPAGGLKPMGEVLWLVDAEAAGEEDQGYGF
ncbi:MAG: 6-phosphogluconolactonase [Alphaproteobacteria bacterium]|jgi:6-phosphogluconolactonase|nr:6-phosphogluconolactonase [Alphaproteobacteria bacterium]MDB5739104.1 6-phosphogluconolactonase [Alphaproteobacteria bacterium]